METSPLRLLRRARFYAFEFAFGIHSGIPVGCVRYFCGNMDRLPVGKKMTFARDCRSHYGALLPSMGYVPCPVCAEIMARLKEPVKIHTCRKDSRLCQFFRRDWQGKPVTNLPPDTEIEYL